MRIRTHYDTVSSRSRKRRYLLAWIKDTIPQRPAVEELTEVWRDGALLCSLINSVVPGACLTRAQSHTSLQHGQDLANRYLGVTKHSLSHARLIGNGNDWIFLGQFRPSQFNPAFSGRKIQVRFVHLRSTSGQPSTLKEEYSGQICPSQVYVRSAQHSQGGIFRSDSSISGLRQAFSDDDLQQVLFTSYLERRLVRYLCQVKESIEELKRSGCRLPLIRIDTTDKDTKEGEVTNPNGCIVKGMGLVMAVKNRRATFYIYPRFPQQPSDFFIEIKGPSEDFGSATISIGSNLSQLSTISKQFSPIPRPCNIVVNYKVNNTYVRVTYVPCSEGPHELSVLQNEKHVIGSPYHIIVDKSSVEPLSYSKWKKLSEEEEDSKKKITRRRLRVLMKVVDFVTEKMLLTEDDMQEGEVDLVYNDEVENVYFDDQVNHANIDFPEEDEHYNNLNIDMGDSDYVSCEDIHRSPHKNSEMVHIIERVEPMKNETDESTSSLQKCIDQSVPKKMNPEDQELSLQTNIMNGSSVIDAVLPACPKAAVVLYSYSDKKDDITSKNTEKSRERYEQAKSFFQKLESQSHYSAGELTGSHPRVARSVTSMENLWEVSQSDLWDKSVTRRHKFRRKKKEPRGIRSAPASDTETRLKIDRGSSSESELGGSGRCKKVLERFHVKDLFLDVAGEFCGGSIGHGVPHREAVLAALRSVDEDLDRSGAVSPYEYTNMSDEHYGTSIVTCLVPLSYQPEFPYLSNTPPNLYRSRMVKSLRTVRNGMVGQGALIWRHLTLSVASKRGLVAAGPASASIFDLSSTGTVVPLQLE
uniref:Calponin-homology (CH) domain-containing protein n=1 Tax=Timema tahoe TaxID=61484 RepID=A0A7R9NXX3_9NEOP|nr:unnamed protein product [Timema tahoe]